MKTRPVTTRERKIEWSMATRSDTSDGIHGLKK